MKTILFLSLLILSSTTYAQKGKSYIAANGLTYRVGDTIIMAKGSGTDSKFLYLGMTGLAAIGNANQLMLS